MREWIYALVMVLVFSRMEASEAAYSDANETDVIMEEESDTYPLGVVIPLEEQSSDVHIGHGTHTYQFRLLGIQEGVQANTPFALSLKIQNERLAFVKDKKNVYQGVTDKNGMTPIFHTLKHYDADAWFIRPRFGQGPNGEDFHLTNESTGEALAGFPYTILMCEKKPKMYTGFTDENGFTAYSASKKPVNLFIYEGDVTGDKALNMKKECLKK